MSTADPVELEVIDKVWNEVTQQPRIYETLRSTVTQTVNAECARQINAGNYDATAALRDVYDVFARHHLFDTEVLGEPDPDIESLVAAVDRTRIDDLEQIANATPTEQQAYLSADSEFVDSILTDKFLVEVNKFGWNEVTKVLFQRLIEQLVSEDELLYIYNRQQVRSHVAEMTRYFALLRQRLSDETPYNFSPNLVKMVKLASADRKQPIIDPGAPESTELVSPLRQIYKQVVENEDVEPAWELKDAMGSDWRSAISETLTTFQKFLVEGLPDEFASLANYQARAFTKLYIDAVTCGTDPTAHVVTASTGGGKTEAFLFPTLAYSLTKGFAGIDGSTAVLTYPRRDLCDNQFQRAFGYITEINRLCSGLDKEFSESTLTISLQHSGRRSVELDCPYCEGTLIPEEYPDTYFTCNGPNKHEIKYASVDRAAQADIVISTQDSLHRRMLDRHGRGAFWNQPYPPKFLVLDEVHIYTDQAGMNVSNVVRRFKRALAHKASQQTPTLVASSATIEGERDFTSRIFDTDDAVHIHPSSDETRTTSREHFIFVKSTDPRDITLPTGDSIFKPREDWDEVTHTTATNLSCMIQVAFAFQHTMRKETAGAGGHRQLDADKDRILGFVDSIDSVSRLAGFIDDAEGRGLYRLRQPDAVLGTKDNNPDCPRSQFRNGVDDEFDEQAVCESLPPNPNHSRCEVYEDGECWWTMQDRRLDLTEMKVAQHKSGATTRVDGTGLSHDDDWDQLISTSALEVGFDHESVIGTFQYRAPRNVPGFIQRKGRGGRDTEDEPITVVILGSSPTDAYYFHHSDILSDPSDEHLEIPLDETNRFVRASHMTTAIFDFFSVHHNIDAERIFEGGSRIGPDIDYLQSMFVKHEQDIEKWLQDAFSADTEQIDRVLRNFSEYIELLNEPVAPGANDTPYWEFFSESMEQGGYTGNYEHLNRLIDQIMEETQ